MGLADGIIQFMMISDSYIPAPMLLLTTAIPLPVPLDNIARYYNTPLETGVCGLQAQIQYMEQPASSSEAI